MGSGHSGEFRCVNPCGQSGKGGVEDQFQPSARAPARHDLVNRGGRKPDWSLREGEWQERQDIHFWIIAWEEALVNQLDPLQILGETSSLEIKICDSVSSS